MGPVRLARKVSSDLACRPHTRGNGAALPTPNPMHLLTFSEAEAPQRWSLESSLHPLSDNGNYNSERPLPGTCHLSFTSSGGKCRVILFQRLGRQARARPAVGSTRNTPPEPVLPSPSAKPCLLSSASPTTSLHPTYWLQSGAPTPPSVLTARFPVQATPPLPVLLEAHMKAQLEG